jgi:hypothetical protein
MRNLSKILLKTLLLKINPVPLNNCSQHKELHLYILKLIIRCITYFWVKQINLTIKGKNDKFVRLFFARLYSIWLFTTSVSKMVSSVYSLLTINSMVSNFWCSRTVSKVYSKLIDYYNNFYVDRS